MKCINDLKSDLRYISTGKVHKVEVDFNSSMMSAKSLSLCKVWGGIHVIVVFEKGIIFLT